ncbi:PREDICTED: uncharacterized protein LOC108762469 [Trachymyrmex cornetzi]|uniref:uncharacterized protein LOC108762469 n=1 Tax=Trachymyrmex cornetzi TaxID=471704 RepID=UPI00084F7448|nr:PREDICTED: uncharacterized protein LOC108762469 [Trachymyrmex cornetzi]
MAATIKRRPRPSRTAVVAIRCTGDATYAGVMQMARDQICLDDIGIKDLRPRRARSGAFLLEIAGGATGAEKADKLAQKMSALTADNADVSITRPEKTGEVRIRDIDESITREDVLRAGGVQPDRHYTGQTHKRVGRAQGHMATVPAKSGDQANQQTQDENWVD